MTFKDKDDEIAYWKTAALYLADCHAATAENKDPDPFPSQCARQRFLNIAGICHAILDAEDMDDLKSRGDMWPFITRLKAGKHDAGNLERERVRVAKRAKDAIDD